MIQFELFHRIKQLINDVFVLPYFLELSTLSLLMASLVFYFSEVSCSLELK